jgi:hypothetical protein
LFNNETSKEGKSYSNIIESVRFYDNAVTNIESQMEQASDMVRVAGGCKEGLF